MRCEGRDAHEHEKGLICELGRISIATPPDVYAQTYSCTEINKNNQNLVTHYISEMHMAALRAACVAHPVAI
eukprot:1978992-Pyramimonas_sp.AAC.1